jgi:hypothetical protein
MTYLGLLTPLALTGLTYAFPRLARIMLGMTLLIIICGAIHWINPLSIFIGYCLLAIAMIIHAIISIILLFFNLSISLEAVCVVLGIWLIAINILNCLDWLGRKFT